MFCVAVCGVWYPTLWNNHLLITLVRLTYLFSPQWLLLAPCTLSIFISIFLYHENQCRVQIKLLLLQAFIIIRQRQTLPTWISFYYSRQYFEKLLEGGSGSFEFYLLVCVIRLECHSIRGHSPDSPGAKRLDRGQTPKHHFETDAVASSWLNKSRDDRKCETRPRNKHQIIRQIRVDDPRKSIHESQENIYHEPSVTSYVYEIRPKTRGPFDGC